MAEATVISNINETAKLTADVANTMLRVNDEGLMTGNNLSFRKTDATWPKNACSLLLFKTGLSTRR